LAQRRKRVFLIACPRNGPDPRTILFEFDGLRRDTAPSREARADVAGTLKGGADGRGRQLGAEEAAGGHLLAGTLESTMGRSRGAGTPHGAIAIHPHCIGRSPEAGPQGKEYLTDGSAYTLDARSQPQCVAAYGGGNTSGSIDVATACNAHGVRMDFDTETLVATTLRSQSQSAHDASLETYIAAPLRAEGFDASEDGTGRQNLVCMAFHGAQDPDVSGEVTHPLGMNQGREVCVLQGRWRGDDGRGYDRPPHVTDLPSLDTQKVDMVALSSVRRLTPRECERLQGFPDNYTLIPYRNSPAKDGPRYKVLGNSMAVPVMRWIGERISNVC